MPKMSANKALMFNKPATTMINQDKSAVRFSHPVAAWAPDIFCNFYSVKSHKIDNNLATTEAREKLSTYLESVKFQKFFDVSLIEIANYQTLRLVYTSDFRAQFRSKLVRSSEYYYFYIQENGLV